MGIAKVVVTVVVVQMLSELMLLSVVEVQVQGFIFLIIIKTHPRNNFTADGQSM